MAENRIKKIKLSNGSVYSIFDEGALRWNPTTKVLYTGNTIVDNVIFSNNEGTGIVTTDKLSITEIDDIPVAQLTEDVLVTDANGNVYKENIRQVLRDVGCITAEVTDEVLFLDKVTLPI